MYLHEQAEVSDVVSFVEEAGSVLGYKAFEGGNGSCRFVIYVTTSVTTHGCSSTHETTVMWQFASSSNEMMVIRPASDKLPH